MDNNYSLADIGAMMKSGDCNGNSWLWVIVLLMFMGGFGYNRNGGEFGQYASAASQQEILFGQRFDALGQKVNSIGDGICSSTYALNNAIQSEGRALQTQMGQLQTAIHSEGEATRALMQQNKIETLQQEINRLNMQAAMCGVVRYPMASTYNAPNPFCNCNNGGTF